MRIALLSRRGPQGIRQYAGFMAYDGKGYRMDWEFSDKLYSPMSDRDVAKLMLAMAKIDFEYGVYSNSPASGLEDSIRRHQREHGYTRRYDYEEL